MTSLFASIPPKNFLPPPRPEDQDDKRLGHHIIRVQGELESELSKMQPGGFVLVGYPDDRGVERNLGRTGALDGPTKIRESLYKMGLPHSTAPLPPIYDLGDIKSWSYDLPEAHEHARAAIKLLRQRGMRVISLGGGHDWAFPDFADFAKDLTDKGPCKLINVDAHLDVRPDAGENDRKSHSGTPFRRIIELNPNLSVHAVGLQEHCNAKHHLEWAQSRRMTTLFLHELPESFNEQWQLVSARLQMDQGTAQIGLSIDLDAFAQSVAPGVSAPQARGLDTALAFRMIKNWGSQTQHLGIYELCPRFDVDNSTSKLAAGFIFEYLIAASA